MTSKHVVNLITEGDNRFVLVMTVVYSLTLVEKGCRLHRMVSHVNTDHPRSASWNCWHLWTWLWLVMGFLKITFLMIPWGRINISLQFLIICNWQFYQGSGWNLWPAMTSDSIKRRPQTTLGFSQIMSKTHNTLRLLQICLYVPQTSRGL